MSRAWACLKSETISHGDYSLTAVQDEDIEAIRLWRNIQVGVLRQPFPISSEQQVSYYSDKIFPTMREKAPTNILMSFYLKGELIGYGGLVHMSWQDSRGEISFLLNPVFTKDKRLYKEKHMVFLKLVADLAFTDLGLNKIFTETWSTRQGHIDNLESFGFRLEGTLKSHIMIDGKFEDALMHRILSTEYNQKDIL
jgi:RimJ/RimL family protein N-acetyltransferase